MASKRDYWGGEWINGVWYTKEQLDRQDAASSSSSSTDFDSLGNKYLDMWSEGLEKSQGYYDQALTAMESVKDVAGKIGQQYDEYTSQFGGIQQQALTAAMDRLGIQDEMLGQFRQNATVDPEAAAGRAVADVATQSQNAREASARDAMRMGLDVTSGRFQKQMGQGRMQEALSRALAGNAARLAEKARGAELAAQGVELADPSVAAGIAEQINSTRANLLDMQGQLSNTYATGIGNISTQLTQNVFDPQGQLGGTFLGMGLQKQLSDDYLASTQKKTQTAPTITYSGSTKLYGSPFFGQ